MFKATLTIHAKVGHSDRAALVLLWLQLPVLGSLCQLLHGLGDVDDAARVRVEHDRRDEAARGRHRHAHVHVGESGKLRVVSRASV